MKIIWSPLAIDRVSKIAEYISQDNPAAARKWIDTIFYNVGLLESSPKIGRIVPEIKRHEIRELIHGNFRHPSYRC